MKELRQKHALFAFVIMVILLGCTISSAGQTQLVTLPTPSISPTRYLVVNRISPTVTRSIPILVIPTPPVRTPTFVVLTPTADLTPYSTLVIATAPPFVPVQPKKLTSSSDNWSSQQGQGGWYFLEDRVGDMRDWYNMRWDPSLRFRFCDGGCWRSNSGLDFVRLDRFGGHAGPRDSVAKAWVSAVSAKIRASVKAYKIDGGGDGVTLRVILNGRVLREARLDGNQTQERAISFDVDTFVEPKDRILLALGLNGNTDYGHTYFDLTISELP